MAEDCSGDLVRNDNPRPAFPGNGFQEDRRVVVRYDRLNDPGRGREELISVGRDSGHSPLEPWGPPNTFAGPFKTVKCSWFDLFVHLLPPFRLVFGHFKID